jgi:hypothetical protein
VHVRKGHQSLTTHERRGRFYELLYYLKILLDTPKEHRSELLSFAVFCATPIIALISPNWLLNILHRIQPQSRMLDLFYRLRRGPCPWLRPRTRWNAFRRWPRRLQRRRVGECKP